MSQVSPPRLTLGFVLWFTALLLLILVPPINDLFRFSLFGIALLALFFSAPNVNRKKVLLLSLGAGAVLLLRLVLPIAHVEESHHVFLVKSNHAAEPWQGTIPAPILEDWAGLFHKAYPAEQSCDGAVHGCWRSYGLPTTPIAWSADRFWEQDVTGTRRVRSFDVRDVLTARLGVINGKPYNWYPEFQGKKLSEIHRDTAPFWVRYTLPPEVEGGALCWQGPLWRQKANETTLQKLHNETLACETLSSSAAGETLWMGFIEPGTKQALALRWPLNQTLWRMADGGLALLGVAMLLVLSLRPHKKRLLIGAATTALAVLAFWLHGGAPVLLGVVPYGAGGDGLTHAGFGREIAQALFHGEWALALRGGEDVFYFMPGLRYLIAFEHMLFGSMHYGEALIVLFFPLILWRLLAALGQGVWLAPLLLISFLAPRLADIFGFSYRFYAQYAAGAIAEPVGYALWILGLALALERLKKLEDTTKAAWAGLGLLFALATFVRPNLAIASVLVLSVLALPLLRQKRWGALLSLGGGFSAIGLCLAHNVAFGARFVTLTSAASIPANLLLPPARYADALSALASGAWRDSSVSAVLDHWTAWIGTGFTGQAHALALVALAFFTLRRQKEGLLNRSFWLLIAAMGGLHLPLFFFHPDKRYAALAWFVVLLAVLSLAFPQGKNGTDKTRRQSLRRTIESALIKVLPYGLARALGFFYGLFVKKTSYAQHGEDLILVNYFERIGLKKGVYVDIGCFHPLWLSNTHLLHKRGWTGYAIDIDPIKTKAFDLMRQGRCQTITAAITAQGPSDADQSLTVYRFKKLWSEIDTLCHEAAERASALYGIAYFSDVVPSKNIRSLFNDVKKVDLINIDIEGLDETVLTNIDLDRLKPEAILFEDNTHWGGSPKVRAFLEQKGYERLFISGGSVCYVKPPRPHKGHPSS